MKKTIAIVACAAFMLFAGKANAQLGINVGYAPVTLTSCLHQWQHHNHLHL